jgi:hypothetical protein
MREATICFISSAIKVSGRMVVPRSVPEKAKKSERGSIMIGLVDRV